MSPVQSSKAQEVKASVSANDQGGAEDLLKHVVDATEAEAGADGCGVAPWYYEQLAILYRWRKRPREELGILERYAAQVHAPCAKPAKLAERLKNEAERP